MSGTDENELFSGQIQMGDIALTSNEAACLQGEEWLSDSVIEFCLEYLRCVKFKKHLKKIEIISPCVAHLLRTLKDEDLRKELEHLRILQHQIVLIPVNNAEGDADGTHWSLMFFHPVSYTFHHIDTMDPTNNDAANDIAFQIVQGLNIEEECSMVTHQNVTQVNKHDCGVHVLVQADHAIRQIVDKGVDSDNFTAYKMDCVGRERRSLIRLLKFLAWTRDHCVDHVL